jgi:hypothetical protein
MKRFSFVLRQRRERTASWFWEAVRGDMVVERGFARLTDFTAKGEGNRSSLKPSGRRSVLDLPVGSIIYGY